MSAAPKLAPAAPSSGVLERAPAFPMQLHERPWSKLNGRIGGKIWGQSDRHRMDREDLFSIVCLAIAKRWPDLASLPGTEAQITEIEKYGYTIIANQTADYFDGVERTDEHNCGGLGSPSTGHASLSFYDTEDEWEDDGRPGWSHVDDAEDEHSTTEDSLIAAIDRKYASKNPIAALENDLFWIEIATQAYTEYRRKYHRGRKRDRLPTFATILTRDEALEMAKDVTQATLLMLMSGHKVDMAIVDGPDLETTFDFVRGRLFEQLKKHAQRRNL